MRMETRMRGYDMDLSPRLDRGSMASVFVTPNLIGGLGLRYAWIPACAGMTWICHPRLDRGSMAYVFVTPDLIGGP